VNEKLRKIIYAMNVSIDGFIAAPDGSLDWSIPDQEVHQAFNALEKDIELHFYGRRMYEIMGFWRTAAQTHSLHDYEIEFARLWNSKPNMVFSTTLEQVAPGDTLVREVIPADILKLKAQSGKYMDVGGAELASTFMNLGLVDEIQLYIVPIVLGGGKPMFQSINHKFSMKHLETRKFSSGIVLLRYQINANLIK
jgi:dihydrofolate reductase